MCFGSYLTSHTAATVKKGQGGDIVAAAAGLHLIQSLKNLFVAMRNEIDQYHDRWYKKVIELVK